MSAPFANAGFVGFIAAVVFYVTATALPFASLAVTSPSREVPVRTTYLSSPLKVISESIAVLPLVPPVELPPVYESPEDELSFPWQPAAKTLTDNAAINDNINNILFFIFSLSFRPLGAIFLCVEI